MEEERKLKEIQTPMSFLDATYSAAGDLDFSFTSTASASSFATTFASSASASARSSLSLRLPSFSASTSLINPLPHSKSNCSPRWSAVRAAVTLSCDGTLHLHLLRHLGSGHLARVFQCRLKGSDSFNFALKVVDLDDVNSAAPEAKLSHVRTEARVLSALDHPFLPTLYAHMEASH